MISSLVVSSFAILATIALEQPKSPKWTQSIYLGMSYKQLTKTVLQNKALRIEHKKKTKCSKLIELVVSKGQKIRLEFRNQRLYKSTFTLSHQHSTSLKKTLKGLTKNYRLITSTLTSFPPNTVVKSLRKNSYVTSNHKAQYVKAWRLWKITKRAYETPFILTDTIVSLKARNILTPKVLHKALFFKGAFGLVLSYRRGKVYTSYFYKVSRFKNRRSTNLTLWKYQEVDSLAALQKMSCQQSTE